MSYKPSALNPKHLSDQLWVKTEIDKREGPPKHRKVTPPQREKYKNVTSLQRMSATVAPRSSDETAGRDVRK